MWRTAAPTSKSATSSTTWLATTSIQRASEAATAAASTPPSPSQISSFVSRQANYPRHAQSLHLTSTRRLLPQSHQSLCPPKPQLLLMGSGATGEGGTVAASPVGEETGQDLVHAPLRCLGDSSARERRHRLRPAIPRHVQHLHHHNQLMGNGATGEGGTPVVSPVGEETGREAELVFLRPLEASSARERRHRLRPAMPRHVQLLHQLPKPLHLHQLLKPVQQHHLQFQPTLV